jgi:hypothetical protein
LLLCLHYSLFVHLLDFTLRLLLFGAFLFLGWLGPLLLLPLLLLCKNVFLFLMCGDLGLLTLGLTFVNEKELKIIIIITITIKKILVGKSKERAKRKKESNWFGFSFRELAF